MKTSLLVLLLLAVVAKVFSQQEAKHSHNMYTYDYVNPGYAGSSKLGDAYILTRHHNYGFKSSEGESIGSQFLIGNFSLPLAKIKSGVGLSGCQLTQGMETVKKGRLTYAYQLKVGEGKLGLGLGLGVFNAGFDFSKLKAESENEQFLTDLKQKENYFAFDMACGLHYKMERAYFGLSTSQVNEANLKGNISDYSYLVRHYYFYGGYVYQTANPLLKLRPSVYVRTAGASATQFTLNFLAVYNSFITGGVLYSTNNDISAIWGLEFNNGSKFDGIKASVAYDLITNPLQKYAKGSYEILVGYSFSLNVEKATKSYKSVRFL